MNDFQKILKNPYRIFASLASKGKLIWMKDSLAIKLIYRGEMNRPLNLKNPETFNEKLQWLKLYDRNPIYTELVDKHAVRKYIKEWIGEEYLIPEINVWDRLEDVDFELLPNEFVMKCTHDSGSAFVCRDKRYIDKNAIINKLAVRMVRSQYWSGMEWPYKNVKPRIIAEQFMSDGSLMGLRDYKFYCFNGEAQFLYISEGLENHETAFISFFDLQGKMLPFHRSDYRVFRSEPKMPSKFSEMITIVDKCAKKIGATFVRVDLYQINNKIYFSEFTFTPVGGYMKFVPEMYDKKIGDLLRLSNKEMA